MRPNVVQERPQVVQVRPQVVQLRPHVVQVRPQLVQVRPQVVQGRTHVVQERPQVFQDMPQVVQWRPRVIARLVNSVLVCNCSRSIFCTHHKLNLLKAPHSAPAAVSGARGGCGLHTHGSGGHAPAPAGRWQRVERAVACHERRHDGVGRRDH